MTKLFCIGKKTHGKDSKTPIYFDRKNKKINAGWVTTFNNYAMVSKNRLTKFQKKLVCKRCIVWLCSYNSLWVNFKDSKINLKKKNKILITGGGMIGQSILFFLNLKIKKFRF
jgi:S-(hydroxymethyl)glutathione dehydrogenase/alcohol dehydrogenase